MVQLVSKQLVRVLAGWRHQHSLVRWVVLQPAEPHRVPCPPRSVTQGGMLAWGSGKFFRSPPRGPHDAFSSAPLPDPPSQPRCEPRSDQHTPLGYSGQIVALRACRYATGFLRRCGKWSQVSAERSRAPLVGGSSSRWSDAIRRRPGPRTPAAAGRRSSPPRTSPTWSIKADQRRRD
jgi:hypothetical protein